MQIPKAQRVTGDLAVLLRFWHLCMNNLCMNLFVKWTLGVSFINMLMYNSYTRKSSGTQLLFDQQYILGQTLPVRSTRSYAQLFNALRSTLCTRKISFNLMAEKPLVEC